MRRSKSEIYLHLVWTTWKRQPLVTPNIERVIYRCIEKEARSLGCIVLAIGGMPDHVHVVAKAPMRMSAARLAQQVKGVSSTFVRNSLKIGEFFGWQDGYGVFSTCRAHVSEAVAYVANQKRHHADNTLWPEWEETHEDVDEGGIG